MDLIRHPIVFLHLPRTGGGAAHAALARVVGAPRVSPVRSAGQAAPGAAQFPPGYALYSGPLDWNGIETLPRGRFTFTVLRDPQERIASLYFHFRALAEAVSSAAMLNGRSASATCATMSTVPTLAPGASAGPPPAAPCPGPRRWPRPGAGWRIWMA